MKKRFFKFFIGLSLGFTLLWVMNEFGWYSLEGGESYYIPAVACAIISFILFEPKSKNK